MAAILVLKEAGFIRCPACLQVPNINLGYRVSHFWSSLGRFPIVVMVATSLERGREGPLSNHCHTLSLGQL